MNFRTFLLLAAAPALIAACCSSPKCTIKGTVTSPLDSVWLVNPDGDILDVAAVQDGAFNFTCDRNNHSLVLVSPGQYAMPASVIPDVKEVQVTLGEGSPTVSGSPLSEELQTLQQWIMQHFNEYNEKAMALHQEGQQEAADDVMQEMRHVLTERCKEVYIQHSQDYIGIQAMTFLMDEIPAEEFIALYEQGGEPVRQDANLGGYYESLTRRGDKLLQQNEDGTFTESEGLLEDYIGQGNYVLVDFWASWCGPCIEETPFVVKAFNDYKDKGLVVLGIPVRDKQEATRKAMTKLGIFYPQILDPQTKLARRFDVTGIPHLFLFGPDGEIVKEGMRGEETDALLRTIFQ